MLRNILKDNDKQKNKGKKTLEKKMKEDKRENFNIYIYISNNSKKLREILKIERKKWKNV